MEQGFCGRDCAVCDIREEYGCAGCRATNGVPPHGPCPIASCCQERREDSCGSCGSLTCSLLPERGDGTKTQARLETVRLEALGGRERAAELGAGLRRLFWVWLGGDVCACLAAAVTVALLAHGGSWALRLVPGILGLVMCLAMGATMRRLGEPYRTVPGLLMAYGAARVVSGAVAAFPASGVLHLLQGGLELVWIFRLCRANRSLLDQIGDRHADLWWGLARWTVAVGAVVCLLSMPLPLGDIAASQFLLWLDRLPAVAIVLVCVLEVFALAVELAAIVLEVIRWVQLWKAAETFRRLSLSGSQG